MSKKDRKNCLFVVLSRQRNRKKGTKRRAGGEGEERSRRGQEGIYDCFVEGNIFRQGKRNTDIMWTDSLELKAHARQPIAKCGIL